MTPAIFKCLTNDIIKWTKESDLFEVIVAFGIVLKQNLEQK